MDPPAPALCLTQAYAASPDQRGGTLIAEHVRDLETHRALLADPDEYRPGVCETCGCSRLHAHDYRDRKVDGENVSFRRYQCQGCFGVWMVLAGFLARCLHQRWDRAQDAVNGTE